MYFAHLGITLMLGVAVFLPLLFIALLRFRSAAVAFAVSGGFSLGAMLGFFVSIMIAAWVLPRVAGEEWYLVSMSVFATAGSIGGAAIALTMLRKLSSIRAWERR